MISDHSERFSMKIAMPFVDGINNCQALKLCDGVIDFMLEQSARMVRNWVLSAFIISLLQDGANTFAGRIAVEHARSGGIVDGEDRLFRYTFLKLSESKFTVRVPVPSRSFAEQTHQWVSNFTEVGDVSTVDIDGAEETLQVFGASGRGKPQNRLDIASFRGDCAV